MKNNGNVRANELISVIVATYNRPAKLRSALQSILKQSYKAFEIIVVNDGGVDVSSCVDGLNHEGKIRHLMHKENRGLAAARNTGVLAARGKYLAYLDDDDLFYPHHLETLVGSLECSNYQVAYTDAIRAYTMPGPDADTAIRKEPTLANDFDRDWLLVTNLAPVICFMHARECIAKAGLFDEQLGVLEDWDFWIRLSRHYDFLHLSERSCEITWRLDGSTMTSSRMADFIHQRKRIYKKYEEFARPSPAVQLAQARTLDAMARALPEKERIQDLIQRTKASGIADQQIVRDLVTFLYELNLKLDVREDTIASQEARIRELTVFREKIRRNPGFKAYHWLKNRA